MTKSSRPPRTRDQSPSYGPSRSRDRTSPVDAVPEDYEVGYGKPPKSSQFQPGQSGNPKGRPKGSPNLATIVEKESNKKMIVTSDGQKRSVSKQEALVLSLFHRALAGNDRATAQLLVLIQNNQHKESQPQAQAQPDTLSKNDEAILREYVASRGDDNE